MIMKLPFLVLMLTLTLSGCQSATITSAFPHSADSIRQQQQTTPAIPIERWQTDNGSQVLFVANRELPMLDIQLTFAAGSSRDQGTSGLARLTSNLIGEDTRQGLTSDDIASGFESLGAVFSTDSYRDMAIISLRTLTEPDFLTPALALFEQVFQPAFEQHNLDRIRTQMLQGLKMQQQVPGPQASKAYMAALFDTHPYATPSGGTLDSLPVITRQQIRDFYQQHYTSGNLTIALVGDLDTAQAKQLADRISRALPQGPAADPLPLAQTSTQHHLEHLNFDSSQTHILLGNQAIYRNTPDWPALYVGNWILGGGSFASRIFAEVREQHGLAYSASSSFSPMASGGPFTISLQTANDRAQQALDLTLDITRRFVAEGPTQAEVQKAIDNITGSFPLSIASNSRIVGQLGAIGFYDLPTDYLTRFIDQIRQVTPQQVRAAMQKALNPDHFTLVSIGPTPLVWPGELPHEHQQK